MVLKVLPPGLKKTYITYPGLNWAKREFHKKDSVMKMYCTVLASLVLTLCECDWWHKFHWFGIIFSKYINLETVKAWTTKYSTMLKYKNLGYTENVLFCKKSGRVFFLWKEIKWKRKEIKPNQIVIWWLIRKEIKEEYSSFEIAVERKSSRKEKESNQIKL